jgi:hypothetical protein
VQHWNYVYKNILSDFFEVAGALSWFPHSASLWELLGFSLPTIGKLQLKTIHLRRWKALQVTEKYEPPLECARTSDVLSRISFAGAL